MTDINLKFYFLLLYAVFNVLLRQISSALCAFDFALHKIKKNLTLLTILMVNSQASSFTPTRIPTVFTVHTLLREQIQLAGGLKWTRTTDLTLIRRAL